VASVLAPRQRRKLNAAVARIWQQAGQFKDRGNGIGFVLNGLQGVFAPEPQPAERRAAIRRLHEASDAYCRRMEYLLAATPDTGDFDRLVGHLRSAGIAVEGWFPLIYRREALMGWAVAGNKPADQAAGAME